MKGLESISNLIRASVLCLTVMTLCSFLGEFWWVFDLLSHGRVQYVYCAALGFVTLFFLHFFRKDGQSFLYVSICTVLVVANLIPVWLFIARDMSGIYGAGTPTPLRVMSLNVLTRNTRHADVVSQIQQEDPDVLLLMEVNNTWLNALAEIDAIYPHKFAIPRPDNFGMVLYSKHEILDAQKHQWGDFGVAYITGKIELGGERISIVALHTVPPVHEAAYKDNFKQSQQLVADVLQREGTAIVMGDFNNTPWSASYQKMKAPGIYNSGAGAPPTGSWLTPLLGGILIDHVLVKNMVVRGWHVGEPVGSDHRAVIVDLGVKP
jgi:endonuclease/exonuclease/phosphatase (EEP) superfamily protein YafD